MPAAARTPRAQATSRGFSLIELLVAISIIAVLIGILIPTLPRVLDTTRRTACQANVRSIGQAFTMYLHDNKDVYPEARYMPKPWLSGDTNPSLNTVFASYLEDENSRVWQCPGDHTVFGYPYTEDGEAHTCPSSYSYDSRIAGQTIEDTFFVRFLNFQPSEIVVLSDYDAGEFETQDGVNVVVDFFHSERNYLFADGHVGSVE